MESEPTPVPSVFVAPGSRNIKFCQSVLTWGSSPMTLSDRTWVLSPDSVVSCGTSVLTVTVCCVEPIFSCPLTVVKPTSRVMGPRTNCSKPSFVKVIVYGPGTRELVSYRPSRLVVKSFEMPLSVSRTVTATPGIKAPVGSVTVPRMSPALMLCAKHAPLPKMTRRRGRIHRIVCLIYCLLIADLCCVSLLGVPSCLLRVSCRRLFPMRRSRLNFGNYLDLLMPETVEISTWNWNIVPSANHASMEGDLSGFRSSGLRKLNSSSNLLKKRSLLTPHSHSFQSHSL